MADLAQIPGQGIEAGLAVAAAHRTGTVELVGAVVSVGVGTAGAAADAGAQVEVGRVVGRDAAGQLLLFLAPRADLEAAAHLVEPQQLVGRQFVEGRRRRRTGRRRRRQAGAAVAVAQAADGRAGAACDAGRVFGQALLAVLALLLVPLLRLVLFHEAEHLGPYCHAAPNKNRLIKSAFRSLLLRHRNAHRLSFSFPLADVFFVASLPRVHCFLVFFS